MAGENPARNVLVEVQPERKVDLLGNAGKTVVCIAFLHLYDGINDCFTRSLGTGLTATTG